MKKYWYQVDCFDDGSTVSSGYEMIQAENMEKALIECFGESEYQKLNVSKQGMDTILTYKEEEYNPAIALLNRTWKARRVPG